MAMPTAAFRYNPARDIEFHCLVGGDVSATYRFIGLTVSESGSPSKTVVTSDAPATVRFAAPLARHGTMEISVEGPPGSKFLAVTEVRQEGRSPQIDYLNGQLGPSGQHFDSTLLIAEVNHGDEDVRSGGDLDIPAFLRRQEEFSVETKVPVAVSKPLEFRRAGETSTDYVVWYGTNRRPVEWQGQVVDFAGIRDDHVSFGQCRVSVPKSHRIGSVGSSWFKRLLTGTDDRLVVAGIAKLDTQAFWSQMSEFLLACSPDERDAVVFLHGFNVSFKEAAIRAAQLGFDLGVPGVMAFYSWPSAGNPAAYTADEATIEASEPFITAFLSAVAKQSGAQRVHLIAHSMGNRGLVRAVERIAATAAQQARVPFSQIILAAADIDQDTFRHLALSYQKVAERTTMYVCSQDRAVEASHWLHGFPRAGLTPPVCVVPGIDTINVSNLDLTLLGHGYVADARDVLQDMHRVIRERLPPERRFGLQRTATANGDIYWEVKE